MSPSPGSLGLVKTPATGYPLPSRERVADGGGRVREAFSCLEVSGSDMSDCRATILVDLG